MHLVADGTLDAELAALLWLLVEDGVPLVVAGEAELTARRRVAQAILDCAPNRPWVIVDADAEALTTDQLGATLRGGVTPAITLRSASLLDLIAALTGPSGPLPEDALRRLGAVLIVDDGDPPRVLAAHYLRPTERDSQGHLQRRPPAVLAAWDAERGVFEHFAWGVLADLGDRVDRSPADFEQRQASRAAFLVDQLTSSPVSGIPARMVDYLASEPVREHAPVRDAAPPPTQSNGTPHLH